MPCDTKPNLTQLQKQKMADAIERLNAALATGEAQVTIGAQGAVAFKGWQEREGVADVCAYRRLLASNSPALRRAVMRAEVTSGNKVDARQVASGTHSHDGGKTWHDGH